jgi:uncharacterized membrane protein (UPF0127 family)
MSGMSALMNFVLIVARLRIRGRLVRSLAAASAVLVILCANPAARAASVQPLEIATKSGVQVFSVEMATTEEEKTQGLMYRKELPDGNGMIFIRADGRILRIAENTEPHSTKIISSGGLAKGVLEVIAGTAQKYGIQPGDRVAHPLFNKR